MVSTATKKLQTQLTTMDQSLRGLIQSLCDLIQKWNPNNNLPPQEGTGNSQSDHDTAFEKLLASIEEAMGTNIPPLTSDSSSFWASQFILRGFQLVKKIPKSTFHLLNAEKKENVFYLSFRTVFSPSEATAEIYWDQELILIGTGKTTLLVTTSAPWSADTRFVRGALDGGLACGIEGTAGTAMTSKEARPPEVDQFAAAFAVAVEDQENAADEQTSFAETAFVLKSQWGQIR